MNDILKQRLVGALILVALGVVFWPIIFVEPGERAAAEQNRIPPRPALETTAIEPPDQAGLRPTPEPVLEDDAGQAEAQVVDVEEVTGEDVVAAETVTAAPPQQATRTEAPVAPALDSDGVPIAWTLQVASVSSAAKADALRDRLLALQDKAYVKKLERGDKDLYRVYVGPKFERAQLEQVQADIDKRFGVRSMIVRYRP